MNNVTDIRLIALILLGMLCTLLTAGCPAPGPQPPPANQEDSAPAETQERVQPVTVNIEISDIIESMTIDEPVGLPEPGGPARRAPESIIFTVNVGNLEVSEGEQLGVALIYEALVPTGERTFLREDPDDPDSNLIQSTEGPIVYDVIETASGRIESWDSGENRTRVFDVPLPQDTYAIRYWAEISVTGGHGEEDFAELPYCTWDEVLAQNRIISPES